VQLVNPLIGESVMVSEMGTDGSGKE